MMHAINILLQTRRLFARAVRDLSDEAMLAIPAGFDNNIAWNLGHVIVTEQALHYRLSGLPTATTAAEVAMYKTGTSPADWEAAPDLPHLRTLLVELPDRLRDDVAAGRFGGFRPYTTSTGVYLETINDSMAFNNFHEGLHLGFILALKNLVA